MMILKKKTIIISTLVLLIVAACYVSIKYGNALNVANKGEDTDLTGIIDDSNDTSVTSNQASSGFFIDVKIDRENSRASQKQELNDLINNDKTSREDRTKATEALMTIVELSGKEMVTEALIKAKGFEDAVVFLDGGKADVTIKAKSIKPEEVNMIKDIVCKETGYPAAKVTLQTLE